MSSNAWGELLCKINLVHAKYMLPLPPCFMMSKEYYSNQPVRRQLTEYVDMLNFSLR